MESGRLAEKKGEVSPNSLLLARMDILIPTQRPIQVQYNAVLLHILHYTVLASM